MDWTRTVNQATRNSRPAQRTPRRGLRGIGVKVALVVLLVGGTVIGHAMRKAGCGHGQRSFGSSFLSAAFSEDDLKDLGHPRYATSAAHCPPCSAAHG